MSTLWDKSLPLDGAVHRFTVGDDPTTDLALVPHDCVASAAHARTLQAAGLLAAPDARALLGALRDARGDAFAGRFAIAPAQEDGHTALEQWLVAQVGEAGKRIHLGRSRNDQVLVAQRLLLRAYLMRLTHGVSALAQALLGFAAAHRDLPLPGYTHLRRAMPSSFGQWAGAYAQGLCEELEAARGVHARLDRCPLGAGPGFGVPLPLDRELTARLLGFSRVQVNPIDCIGSRGRDALAVLDWLCSVAGQLEKLHWDLALYSTEEFGFVRLPVEFTTGSSAMPQKRNPDVVELARARCRQLRALRDQVLALAGGLPSSYHRDLQLTKKPLLEALEAGVALLEVSATLIARLEPQPERAAAACTPELWATDAAYQRAAAGPLETRQAFRDAYKAVAAEIAAGAFAKPAIPSTAVALGAPGRLELGACRRELEALDQEWRDARARIAAVEAAVFEL
jgi:argininosuccinate lyase